MAGSRPSATAERPFKTVVPFTSGHGTAISQQMHCCKIMIYSLAVGCFVRIADSVPADAGGGLTWAAPRPRRSTLHILYAYMAHICARAYSSLSSLPFFCSLRGWTGGGGEKQLDGTNDVTNNTFPRTHSHCGKQTIANITHPWSDC